MTVSDSKTRKLQNKVAIVTGASRGIGKAIAESLAQHGAQVVLTYQKNAEQARALVKHIQSLGTEAMAIEIDITRIADITHLFAEVKAHFGTIDIFVSNAFPPAVFKPIAELTEAEYDSMFAATKGTYFALGQAAQHIRDGGRILVVSTESTMVRSAAGGAYAGSKAALEQFVYALAKELGSRKITVNALSPGLVETGSLVLPREQINHFVNNLTPLGRIGQPDDIADVVAFLVSQEARWITGQTLHVSGGLVI